MTIPRAIGPLRPFPLVDAANGDIPQTLTQWFVDARYAISADGAKISEKISAVTTDATATLMWSYEMPINSVVLMQTHVVGINSDASKVTAIRDACCFSRAELGASRWYMTNAAPEYARDWYETDFNTALTTGVDGNNATISITGIAGESWKWQGWIEYTTLRA